MAKVLFGKEKSSKVRTKYQEAFAFIVAETTKGDPGFCRMPEDFVKKMIAVEPTLVEASGAADPGGVINVRATAAGLVAGGAAPDGADAGDPSASNESPAASPFEIFETSTIPAPLRGGNGGPREEVYPFSKLEKVGMSFFIKATEAKPDPAKSIASTVNTANVRFKAIDKDNKPTGKDGRHFIVRPRKVGDVIGMLNGVEVKETADGARIYRDR